MRVAVLLRPFVQTKIDMTTKSGGLFAALYVLLHPIAYLCDGAGCGNLFVRPTCVSPSSAYDWASRVWCFFTGCVYWCLASCNRYGKVTGCCVLTHSLCNVDPVYSPAKLPAVGVAVPFQARSCRRCTLPWARSSSPCTSCTTSRFDSLLALCWSSSVTFPRVCVVCLLCCFRVHAKSAAFVCLIASQHTLNQLRHYSYCIRELQIALPSLPALHKSRTLCRIFVVVLLHSTR